MSLRWYLKVFGILLSVVSGTLGFSARLPISWEKYPSVSFRRRRPADTRSALSTTRGESLAEDEEKIKDEDTEESRHVFIASSEGVESIEPVVHSPGANSELTQSKTNPTFASSMKSLFQMCRPSNLPGVCLLHILGVYLSLSDKSLLWPVLVKPQMIVTLFVLIGVSFTSMVINDYYDAKSGVDARKHTALVDGELPLSVVRAFLNYEYALLLLGAAVMPGNVSRLSVMAALMLTYWYTKHLKPITWLKNFVCASIMAFAPITSGAGAMFLAGTCATEPLLKKTSLWRLVGMLFSGFMAREIFMDINDVADDRLHRVRTVPVKYGRKFGATIGLAFTVNMSALALVGPILERHNRRLLLAGFGSGLMLLRAFNVYRTGGEDRNLLDKSVNEAKLSVLLLLASFV